MDSQKAEKAGDSADNEGFNAGLAAKMVETLDLRPVANIPFSISPEQIPRVVPPKRDYQKLAFWLSIALFCAVIIGIAIYVAGLDCTDIIKCVSNLPMWNTTFANATG
jgi:hypothetical protein